MVGLTPEPIVMAPAAVVRLFVPMKAKLLLIVVGLASACVIAAEASIAPPLMTSVLPTTPKALALPMLRTPSLTVILTDPARAVVFPPERIRVPFPVFVIPPDAAVVMTPLNVSAFVLTPTPGEFTVMVLTVPPAATVPLKTNGELPTAVKLELSVIGLVAVRVAPNVLSIKTPVPVLLIVNPPVPRAAAALILTVPLLRVKPPLLKVLAAESVSVPAPALVIPWAEPLMMPPTMRLPPLTVTVGLAVNVTAPLPR